MTTPEHISTGHIWLYALSAMLLATAVVHAVLAAILGEPVVFVNLHIGLAIAAGLVGWRFECAAKDKRHSVFRREVDRLERSFHDS